MWLGVKRQVLAVAEDGFAPNHAADVALELVLNVPSQASEDRSEELRVHEVQAVAVGARIWNLMVVQAFIGFEGQLCCLLDLRGTQQFPDAKNWGRKDLVYCAHVDPWISSSNRSCNCSCN